MVFYICHLSCNVSHAQCGFPDTEGGLGGDSPTFSSLVPGDVGACRRTLRGSGFSVAPQRVEQRVHVEGGYPVRLTSGELAPDFYVSRENPQTHQHT